LFEQTFKNIHDKLWKDAGCSSELDYVEQASWILFLKYLDDLEKDRRDAAEAGFGREQLTIMQSLINAENSDIFDVLEYALLPGSPSIGKCGLLRRNPKSSHPSAPNKSSSWNLSCPSTLKPAWKNSTRRTCLNCSN